MSRQRPILVLSLLVAASLASAASAQTPPAAPAAANPPPPTAEATAPAKPAGEGWIARYDELYQHRDENPAFKEMYKLADAETTAHPDSYEGWWRMAQLDCWQANGMIDGTDLKAQIGKACWDAGEKAVAINATDVKGQYWATVGMGLYSEGLGILSALSQGIEGKFKNRVTLAIAADKNYLDGGPTMLFGRFYWKLPWPKRDLDQSEKLLRETLAAHPNNLRAKMFLADTCWDNGKKDESKKLIQEILDAPLGWDKPDDKRNKAQAKKRQEDH